MSTVTNRGAVREIAYARPFRNSTGSLRADYVSTVDGVATGWMPRAAADMLADAMLAARAAGEPLYVVWSYGTPIAWGRKGELLTVPAVRYSNTTSRHQSVCRGGILDGSWMTTGQTVKVAA